MVFNFSLTQKLSLFFFFFARGRALFLEFFLPHRKRSIYFGRVQETVSVQNDYRGVARIFQRGDHRGYSPDHHPGIADYIWFIPLLSLVYRRAQSYYRSMKALTKDKRR